MQNKHDKNKAGNWTENEGIPFEDPKEYGSHRG